MAWDLSDPDGTDLISLGDDSIRAFKTDIQDALQGQDTEGVEAIFPGSDLDSPVYRYRGLRGLTGTRPTSGQYGLFSDTTRNVIQRDNGTTWDDVATLIPAGTVMVFYQETAPVGWTKLTDNNDKALRVVSGATGGSAGGTVAFSTSLAHTHTVAGHTHGIPEASIEHKHVVPISPGVGGSVVPTIASWGQGSQPITTDYYGVGGSGTTGVEQTFHKSREVTDYANGNTGSAAPATDSQGDVVFAYIDVICASKD
jgi:hypothetical protein